MVVTSYDGTISLKVLLVGRHRVDSAYSVSVEFCLQVVFRVFLGVVPESGGWRCQAARLHAIAATTLHPRPFTTLVFTNHNSNDCAIKLKIYCKQFASVV